MAEHKAREKPVATSPPIHRSVSESSFLNHTKEDTPEKEYTFHLEVLDQPVSLLCFTKSEYKSLMFTLLKEVIFKDEHKFFALTVTDQEISVFLDQDAVDRFIKPTNNYSADNLRPTAVDRDYRVIKVYDLMDGVTHIGIVSKISTLLAASNIPILYVNTYNNNYILVPDKYLEQAQRVLTSSDFVFVQKDL
jgi:hypothetical protein